MRTKQNNSLNPYCSGRWSRTLLMEFGIVCCLVQVLILIVVEDGLVLLFLFDLKTKSLESLNPYCSGRWSRTNENGNEDKAKQVLILIVVEDGLVPSIHARSVLDA